MNNKGDMFLITKMLFAIFLVIFVSFVVITVVNSRSETLKQRENFDYYTRVNNLMETALNSPCLVSDYVQDKNYQLEHKGFISIAKLNLRNNENSDIYCMDNFYFLYSFSAEDILNKKTWKLGLAEEPDWVERIIETSLPIALNYNYTTIHPGRAKLSAYIGEIPRFYGMIKLACITKDNPSINIETDHIITYSNTENKFCVDDECFFAYFSCKVNDFTLQKGSHLALLQYDNELDVVT